jgi:hypothetical protein
MNVPGDHMTMMQSPSIDIIARRLRLEIAEVSKKAGVSGKESGD